MPVQIDVFQISMCPVNAAQVNTFDALQIHALQVNVFQISVSVNSVMGHRRAPRVVPQLQHCSQVQLHTPTDGLPCLQSVDRRIEHALAVMAKLMPHVDVEAALREQDQVWWTFQTLVESKSYVNPTKPA